MCVCLGGHTPPPPHTHTHTLVKVGRGLKPLQPPPPVPPPAYKCMLPCYMTTQSFYYAHYFGRCDSTINHQGRSLAQIRGGGGGQCVLSKYQVAIPVLILGIINLKKNTKTGPPPCPPPPPPPPQATALTIEQIRSCHGGVSRIRLGPTIQ